MLMAGFWVSRVNRLQSVRANDSFKPFVVHQSDQSFIKGKAVAPAADVVFARRQDGSWAHTYATSSPRGEVGQALEFADVRGGRSVHTEPFTRSAATFHVDRSEFARKAGYGFLMCDGTEQNAALSHFSMLGYDVAQILKSEGADKITRWVAPALNCYPLKEHIDFGSETITDIVATSIREGDPPDSMFEVPAGYVERSPSETQAVYMQRYPGVALFNDDALATIEKRYQAARQ